LSIFRNSGEKIQVSLKSDKNKEFLQLDQYTFLIISRSVLLRMRNVSDKILENIKALILCLITFIRKSCHLWYNWGKYCTAGQTTDDITAQERGIWISKATNTHSHNVILIASALHKRASMLLYTDLACLVFLLPTSKSFTKSTLLLIEKIMSWNLRQNGSTFPAIKIF